MEFKIYYYIFHTEEFSDKCDKHFIKPKIRLSDVQRNILQELV